MAKEKLTFEELNSLSDDKLYSEIGYGLYCLMGNHHITENMKKLNYTKKVVYVLYYFEWEMREGGLCDFLVYSYRSIEL